MTLRLSKKPYNERKRLTPAQDAAHRRSFRIFQLRGLYGLAHILSPDRRAAVFALIDADLAALGAEPQSEREVRLRAEAEARWRSADLTADFDEVEMPF